MCECVLYERQVDTLESIQDISSDTKFSAQRSYTCPRRQTVGKGDKGRIYGMKERTKGTRERREKGQERRGSNNCPGRTKECLWIESRQR